jgi:carboxypeptidase C (cathepsin A)
MRNLVLPDKIEIRLVKFPTVTVSTDNVLVYIKTHASHKNDMYLGPYMSDKDGMVTMLKADLESDVEATYDSGLMDYSNVESSFSFVEIRLYNQEEIDRLIENRTKVWTTLLKGEEKRWNSIEHLVDTLKQSKNKYLKVNDFLRFVRADFDGSQKQYNLELNIYKK